MVVLDCLYLVFLHFVLFAFCHICILLHLYFVSFAFCYNCIMSYLHFVTFAICPICILLHLHFVGFAFCLVCILSGLHFVCFWHFVTFAFCQICILLRIPKNTIKLQILTNPAPPRVYHTLYRLTWGTWEPGFQLDWLSDKTISNHPFL